MRYYDARLLGYMALLNIPLQRAIDSLYNNMPPTSNRVLASSLVYNSSQVLSFLSAQFLFETIHDVHKKTADQYYVLPTTEYAYKRHKEFVKSQPIETHEVLNKRADALIAAAPRYSKGFIDITTTAFFAKVAYGTLAGYYLYKNPIKGLLFGTFVPYSIIRAEVSQAKK